MAYLDKNQMLLSEVLQKVSNAKTKAKKIELLKQLRTDALTSVFLQPGDIVYGRFTGVVNHTNSNATLLGYRG